VRQYFANDHRIFNTGYYLHQPTTCTADTHLYIEHSLEPLCGAAFRTAQPLTLSRSRIRLFQSISFYISGELLGDAERFELPTLEALQERYLPRSKAQAIPVHQLRLPAFNEHHQRIAEQATANGWEYGRYLSHLCEQKIAQRYESRVRSWSREAKLPVSKSFATLDVSDLPAIIQKKVIALREQTDWVQRNENVLLIGPSGKGKSHLAAALTLH